MHVAWLRTGVLLIGVVAGFSTARGEDYCLTIGGGYAPQGNQVSLEKNVRFFQELLAEKKPEARHDAFFGDGAAPGRDLQFADPEHEAPEANRLMAEIFANDRFLELDYRSSEVPGVRGESNRDNVLGWFQENGPKLKAGDRLLLYATAHGGKSDQKENAYNTKLFLWNRQHITAAELAEQLDRLPAGVQVVAVMVQCYSGGFSHLIFKNAKAADGLSERVRCGFFATVHERPAAGCTPDINEEDYREYSSDFWAALRGKTRTGEPVAPPDFDGDGQISFDEAHGHVVLTSTTIDIPVKTSDAFLRTYSKLKEEKLPNLLAAEAPFDQLLALASPTERAVLEGLAGQLELTGEDRVKQARALGEQIEKQREQLAKEIKQKESRTNALRQTMQRNLQLRWPELGNLLHPASTRLLREDAVEFVAAVHAEPDYSEFAQLRTEIAQKTAERLDLERRWAKCQRLIRAAENVALAANLSKVATPDLLARYEALLAAERGVFAEGK